MEMAAGNETILLVEDEEGVLDLAAATLSACGYQVLQGRNGVEATAVAAAHPGPIHLLVTDVIMPRMGGRETAAAVVEIKPDARILFVSGYTDDEMLRGGIVDANVPFLQKPYTPMTLARKVREVLDQVPRVEEHVGAGALVTGCVPS